MEPNEHDDDEARYPDTDEPEGREPYPWEDALAAISGNLASIAVSLHGILEVARERRTRGPKKEARATPFVVPPELTDLQLYREDRVLCERWEELKKVWAHAYPGVSVVAEVRRAHAWEMSNPSKMKKDRRRFLAAWMAREQDRGRGPVKSTAPQKSEEQCRQEQEDLQRYLEGKWGQG